MTQTLEGEAGPKPWRLKVALCLAVLILSATGLQCWVASPKFFEAYVLPRIGKALEAEAFFTNGTCVVEKDKILFTAQDARVSRYSSLVFRNCRVGVVGQDPPLMVRELRMEFGGFGLFGRPLRLRNATIISPELRVVATNADSNLTPLMEAVHSALNASDWKKRGFALERVEVRDGSIRRTHYTQGPNGTRQDGSMQVTAMNFTSQGITPSSLDGFLADGLPPFFSLPPKPHRAVEPEKTAPVN